MIAAKAGGFIPEFIVVCILSSGRGGEVLRDRKQSVVQVKVKRG